MNRRQSAFSLVELLIVVAIIGIIAGFGVPALSGVLRGSALTQAANQLTDTMSLARQHAISKNRIVEVRFYRFADPEIPGENVSDNATWVFRAFQFFEISDGGVIIPVGKYQRFPDTMMMNPGTKLSTLLENNSADKRFVRATDPTFNKDVNPELPRGVGHNYDYVFFRFLPDGSTSLTANGVSQDSAGGKYYITVHSLSDRERTVNDTVPPPDFVTWQIEPVSGTSKVWRPGLK